MEVKCVSQLFPFFVSGEGVPTRTITYAQLRTRVARIASALKARGVVMGDRIVMYLPNFAESVEIMLAVASIGAIVSATSPDFGVHVSIRVLYFCSMSLPCCHPFCRSYVHGRLLPST